VIEFGRGESFRRRGWLERAGQACRAPLANSRLKKPLKQIYESALDQFTGRRLVARLPHGETVRLAAANRHVAWNPEEYEAFRRVVKAGATVLDVGANLGAYTVLLAGWVSPGGRVHAFEPAPEARRGLEKHLALNRVTDRVTVHAEALSDGRRSARFRAIGMQGDNRLLPAAGAEGIVVATTSIDEFCAANAVQPSFIKLDVEGAELDVLRGARSTIASGGEALALFVEMHPQLWSAFGYARADLEAELERQGLRAERLDGQPDPWSLAGVTLRLRPCAS
jgi:FkbM family methyltransferase